MGKRKGKVDFALEMLQDGRDAAETIRQEKGQDDLFTRDEWEEVRSSLEFAIKILKGEAVRGG